MTLTDPVYDSQLLSTLALFALVAHQVFRRYETFSFLAHAGLLLFPPLLAIQCSARQLNWTSLSPKGLLLCYTFYYFVLGVSVIAYRLSPIHPLSRYPGPVAYKVSKLVWAYQSLDGYSHKRLKTLHEHYGDVVRIGPNEISFRDANAIGPILGAAGVPKSTYYIGTTLGRITNDVDIMFVGIMNPEEHLRRRRAWNRAFSTAAIKGYEDLVAARARLLIDKLGEQPGEVSLNKWMNNFSYDIMCDMAFGGGSELLKEGDENNLWAVIEEGVEFAFFFSHVPWLAAYVGRIPGAAGPLDTLISHSHNLAAERLKRGSDRRDLYHYLSNEDLRDRPPPTMRQMQDDGLLAVVAGADTTASALTCLFFSLATHPGANATLQAEVDKHFPRGEDPLRSGDYRDMHYLTAVINETMRLYPPAPGGGSRRVPPHNNAMVVGSTVIPPGTFIWVPSYAVQRDPRNFTFPDTFWPERWLVASGHLRLQDALAALPCGAPTTPAAVDLERDFNFIHNDVAWLPFSHGPMNCAGKNIAMVELRMVVCAFVHRFEVRLRDGWDVGEFERGFKDYFTASRPELPVQLRVR